jgi:aminoglycoside phosphotransferase (APT) family kinase protein
MALEDRPAAIRAGEELDLARLEPYLASALGLAGPLAIEQFPGGHSNLTYLARMGGRELVLRRPPFGSKVKTAHDMGREFRLLSKLAPAWPLAPRPVLHCEDESILGAPFYLMERLRGVILRKQPPPGLATDGSTVRALCERFIDTLVALHGLDFGALGLDDFGKPDGYLARQVSGWTRRYQDARTDDVPDMESLARWLADHLPASPAPSIIHNDFKYDNLVLDPADPTRIVGILDWEMATIGDPLADLGTSLSYWIEASDPPAAQALRFGPTTLAGSYTRRELAARYAAATGRDTSGLLYYYVFGLFKNAVVVQQIFARYQKGLTRDPRFAGLIDMVRIAAAQGVHALAAGRL